MIVGQRCATLLNAKLFLHGELYDISLSHVSHLFLSVGDHGSTGGSQADAIVNNCGVQQESRRLRQ